MKKILYIATLAAMILAGAVSCSKNLEGPLPDGQTGISLQFYNSTLSTRAEKAGQDNENRVDRILFFVFPVNAEGTVDDDAEYIFSASYESGAEGWTAGTDQWVYSRNMTTEELNKLFPNGATKAKIFAVANYVDQFGYNSDMDEEGVEPGTTFPEDVKTWKAMHELEVGPTFFYDDKDPNFLLRWPHVLNPDSEDLFFVMVGEADLELTPATGAKAEVALERLASKVTVNFEYDNFVEVKTSGNITWVPQSEAGETRVYLSNAIEHTTLGGPLSRDYVADSCATATKPLGNGTRDIFEYAYNFMNDVPEVDGKKQAHFYTYPINIEEGADNQPYLKLVLPWYGYKYYGSKENAVYSEDDPDWVLYKQKEVYYKIVLPRETIKDPNCIYEYSVKVNIIGSDKEVKIIGEEYVVKDWLSNEAISSNVATGRYISLDIPKDTYDMYTDEIDISFVSSGTVIAKIDEIYQLDLSGSSPTPQYFMQDDGVTAIDALKTAKGINDNDIKGWVTIPSETSYLKINHAMDNRLMINNQKNNAFDMSPYVFKVTLHLEEAGDDTSFDRTVTITQYPSLYVTSKKSNGIVWVNNYTYGTTTPNTDSNGLHYSYAYNSLGTGSNNNRIGSISSTEDALSTTRNNNGYNMIVHPTVLDEGLGLVIGEAREATGGALANITGLSNYKAGRNDTAARKVVSPGFMIASSYGKTMNMNFDRAKERCASYQENGYPAGRWRIPTEGEIEFLVKMSNYGFIPSLFDGSYWASSGRIYTSTSASFSNSTNSNYVRCIYDTWYWGEEPYEEGATTWLGFQD